MKAKSGKQSRISRATLVGAVVCMVLYVVLVAWSVFSVALDQSGMDGRATYRQVEQH